MFQDKIFKLKGKVQHYAWGGYDYIPHWLGIENTEHKPEESIGKRKMQSLLRAAEEYQYQNQQWKFMQIDVLSITMIKGKPIEYFLIEDVYF